MVLQHARSYPQSSHPRRARPHPNLTRIVGMAGAIALNISLLLLLLVPMTAPISVPEPDIIDVDWRTPEKKVPPPPPPVRVDVVRPQTRPQTQVRPDIAPPRIEPVIIENGELPADPVVDPIDNSLVEPSIEPSGPVPGVRLEYAHAPAPPYPRRAVLDGLQGVVMLQILVDIDGRPLEVSIQKSSGHRELDDAARRFVLKHWTFRPAMKDGRAVQAIGLVPIDFNLGR